MTAEQMGPYQGKRCLLITEDGEAPVGVITAVTHRGNVILDDRYGTPCERIEQVLSLD
jgi:hypothetical protein